MRTERKGSREEVEKGKKWIQYDCKNERVAREY